MLTFEAMTPQARREIATGLEEIRDMIADPHTLVRERDLASLHRAFRMMVEGPADAALNEASMETTPRDRLKAYLTELIAHARNGE